MISLNSYLAKIGILATACRRQGAKNAEKRQKKNNVCKIVKPTRDQWKNLPERYPGIHHILSVLILLILVPIA